MGSGTSGLYPSLHSSSKNNAPIQKPGDLRYSKKKTEGYLLNLNHPQGGSKAKFMHDVLGYSQADGKEFHMNIISAIKDIAPSKSEETGYGKKHTFPTKLIGKNGKTVSANVVVVIQKDKGRKTYKIVTVYPDKKEK